MADLNEFVKEMQRGGEAKDAAVETMETIRKEISTILDKLCQMADDVKEFQEKCNIARTAGTSANVVGAVAVIGGCALALFTGGASLPLTAVAVGSTVGGTACNVITDKVDSSKTKEYLAEIESLLGSLADRCKKLERLLADYNRVIQWLKDNHGVDNGVASWVIEQMKNVGGKGAGVLATAASSAAYFKAAGEMINIIKTMNTVGKLSKTAYGGTSFVLTKSASSLTAGEISAIAQYSPLTMKGVTIGGKLLQGTLAIVSVGVTIWEIKGLVDSWNSKHPATKAIEDVRQRLRDADKEIFDLLDAFHAE
jgi:hypothetical protein